MHCTYVGQFNKEHVSNIKKRRMIGPAKEKALTAIIDDGLSCETYREREAGRLMTLGMFIVYQIYNNY